jgi:Skp family chaperone for outer membrane proteins
MKSLALILNLQFLIVFTAQAESSFELTCRVKAKELAAETYKNCVTEQRQSQLEQIRKDYKEELSNLKNRFDKKLKKIGSKSSNSSQTYQVEASQPAPQAVRSNRNQRSSGARSLPRKSVKTQMIDLTSPSSETTAEDIDQSQNSMKSDSDSANDIEIVELPTQE